MHTCTTLKEITALRPPLWVKPPLLIVCSCAQRRLILDMHRYNRRIGILSFCCIYVNCLRSTVPLDPQITTTTKRTRPSYEIVTTNYGWTTPASNNFPRHILTGEFFRAVLSHPQYNATSWADLEQNPDPTRQIVAFMDVDTCLEVNYPTYGMNWWTNIETNHPTTNGFVGFLYDSCDYLHRAATSPALLANPESRLILLDCSGSRQFFLANVCRRIPSVFDNPQVVVAYMSAHERDIRQNHDVGLPPPAIKPNNLTSVDRSQITSCQQQRRYLFSFQGRGGYGRENMMTLQHDDDMYIRIRDQSSYIKDISTTSIFDEMNYTGIMENSVFAGAPRGDTLFSYRFAEILSAGTIPVVYGDGWVPPFHAKVVNWTNCAVFIAESEYHRTGDVLRDIPLTRRCQMQRYALEVWDKFVSTRAGWVQGLVDSVFE